MKAGIRVLKIVDKDKGAKALEKALVKLNERTVIVGIFGEKADEPHGDSGFSNADVATCHEFGTSNIPERSFIRATVDNEQDNLKALEKKAAIKIMKGAMDADRALHIIGIYLQSKVVETIRNKIAPPLQQKTIDRKGSSTPLIDSGQLVQSITFAIKDNK